MEIARLVGIALVTTVFLMFLRQEKPQIAVLLSIAFGIVVFFMIIGKLFSVVQVVSQLSRKAEVNFFLFRLCSKSWGLLIWPSLPL